MSDFYAANHWHARYRALENVPLVLRLAFDAAPGLFVAGLIARICAALVPLAILLVARSIIDALVQIETQSDDTQLYLLVAAEFALAALGVFLLRLIDYCEALAAERFTLSVSLKIIEHAARLDQSSYEDPSFYDKLERARLQARDRVGMLRTIGEFLQNSVLAISLGAGLAAHNALYVVILFAATVPAFLADSYFSLRWYSLRIKQTPARRMLDYLRYLTTSRDSSKEMKLYGLNKLFAGRYQQISNSLYGETHALLRHKLAGSAFALLGTIGQYVAYAMIVTQALKGTITVGTVVFLTGAVAGAARAVQEIFVALTSIADQALFVSDLREYLAVRPAIANRPNALPVPRPIRRGFEFIDVSFSYPGSPRKVLDGVSFVLRPGERLALVGENGEGKTTLVKLLLRLYEPSSGRILLDGHEFNSYDMDDLRSQLGVIFQDFVRYETTAAENIGIGDVARADDRELIKRAAQWSGASDTVRHLPHGLDQLLGRQFQGGVDLSGGEWQKFALARAYMRDAQVLVLDEPSAALDARAEREVFERFSDLTRNRMALLISHRFSTVRTADRIIVLANGRIIEEGNHEQLIRGAGRYHQLYTLQAEAYIN